MRQELVVLDTLSAPAGEVPSGVVRTQIDSALSAELEVSPFRSDRAPRSAPKAYPASLVPMVLFMVCLLLLSGLRWFGRRRLRPRERPAGPSPEPARLGAPDPTAKRAAGRSTGESMVLPPHVVALLQRVEERRRAEALGDPPTESPEPTSAPEARSGGVGGVDYWIGR